VVPGVPEIMEMKIRRNNIANLLLRRDPDPCKVRRVGVKRGSEPHLRDRASAVQETLHTSASTTVAISHEALCVATTGRICRSSPGRREARWGIGL
jgi:hypothetical protein